MKIITNKNLLSFISSYFTSIGCNEQEVNDYFSARRFNKGIVLNLPAVCLLPSNKPESSRSKQTHIHVTSGNRYFFYDESVIKYTTESSPWIKQELVISLNNINSLLNKNTMNSFVIKDTFMMKKIATRKNQEIQVQLSKITQDETLFHQLRQGLYENDLIIFLKYADSNKLFVLGIPYSFYNNRYIFDTKDNGNKRSKTYTSLSSRKAIPVKNAIKAASENFRHGELIDSDEPISDAIYQNMVDSADASVTEYTPIEYIAKNSNDNITNSNRPSTNPSIGKEAIVENRFCCAIDNLHRTFIKPDGTKYLEVHHLIPLKQQNHFRYKLDCKANIIPLCPNCHRMLHYGCNEEIKPTLKKLYDDRIIYLKQSGLDITFEQLVEYYK